MERRPNILLSVPSDVLFSCIPNPQRPSAPRISVCVCWGGGAQKRKRILARFIKTDFLLPLFLWFTRQFLSPQILLVQFFMLTWVQALLISLCDRCDGDSSAIIIETQPPLCRSAAYLSFMDATEGRKTNNHRCMDFFVYSAPSVSVLMAVSLACYNIDEHLLIPRK